MPLFGSKPSKAEVRAFGRNRRGSAKVAEAYAKQKRDQEATRAAMRERRAAAKRSR